MIIIGDIGNTDTKICIINSNYKIIKRILLPTKKINNSLLAKKLNSSITDLTPIKFPCRPWAIIMIPIPVNNAHEFFTILVMIRCRYSFLKELQRDNEKDYVFFKAKKE